MPKYLVQKFTEKGIGRLFIATPQLEERVDMHPWDGEVPANMIVKIGAPVVKQPARAPLLMKMDIGMDAHGFVESPETTTGAEVPTTASIINHGANSTETVVPDEAPTPDPDPTESPVSLVPTFTPEQKIAKIVEVIGKFTPGNKEQFTEGGLPRIDALIDALGGADVSAPERAKALKVLEGIKK